MKSKTIWMQGMYQLRKRVGGYSSSRCTRILPPWNDFQYILKMATPLCMIQRLKQRKRFSHVLTSKRPSSQPFLRPASNFLKLLQDCYIQIVLRGLSGNRKKENGRHGNRDVRLAEYSSVHHL